MRLRSPIHAQLAVPDPSVLFSKLRLWHKPESTGHIAIIFAFRIVIILPIAGVKHPAGEPVTGQPLCRQVREITCMVGTTPGVFVIDKSPWTPRGGTFIDLQLSSFFPSLRLRDGCRFHMWHYVTED